VHRIDGLIAEAAAAEVTGWDFSWLDGRATEERPPWGYSRLLAERLPRATSALDIDTGEAGASLKVTVFGWVLSRQLRAGDRGRALFAYRLFTSIALAVLIVDAVR